MLCIFPTTFAQERNWKKSVLLCGGLTTSSRLYPHPDEQSSELRTEYETFEYIFSGSMEFRYAFSDADIYLYGSAEYIKSINTGRTFTTTIGTSLPMEEGIICIPLEFGVGTYIPLGDEKFKLTMNGGVGTYYAIRHLVIAKEVASPSNTSTSLSIHVGIGIEYIISPCVALQGGVRFRNPEIRCENSYQNTTYTSKIILDGMNLNAGVMILFPE